MDDDDHDIFEDDLDILEIIDYGFPKKTYKRNNHFENLDEHTFFQRFRLMKATVLHLLTLIEGELEYPTDLNNSVSPINQLLTTLRFYASSGHLATTADYIGMDPATASRIVGKVSVAIARLYPQFVKMPVGADIIKTQRNFHEIASFPRVVGVVDGTHIKIQSSGGEDAEVYRNRKGYFSINTQVVCDSNLRIMDLVARWPGSVHDATVFNNSRLKTRFENNDFENCILLGVTFVGDSGYILRRYMLTPLANPTLRKERLYNESLIRTRNCIERCTGVWKRGFPVIAYGMRVKEDTVLSIIVATAVLHNLAKGMLEDEPPVPEDLDENNLNYLIEMGNIGDVPNNNLEELPPHVFRDDLINNYFAQL